MLSALETSHSPVTMLKQVDKKVKPVSTPIPAEFKVTHTFPHNPLATLPKLDIHLPNFIPTKKLTKKGYRA